VTAVVRFFAGPEVQLGRRWRISFECIRLPSGVGRLATASGVWPGSVVPSTMPEGDLADCRWSIWELLRQTVLTPPRKLGYAFTAWTLARLGEFLKRRTGVTVRPHYLGRLLHRMGIARRRPQHVLEGKRDEAAHDPRQN
jgi:hypothetical protein